MTTRLLCAALLVFSIAAAPATTNTSSIKTRFAARVLLVNSSNFSPDEDEMFISMKHAAAELGKQRAGLNDANLGEWFNVGNYPEGLRVTVKVPESSPPVAAEIADALVDWVRNYLSRESQKKREEMIQRADDRVDNAARSADQADNKLRQIRQKLRDLSGRTDVTPGTLVASLAAMDDTRQKLELDLLAKTARRSALEAEISRTAERIQKLAGSDEIAAELKKVVEAREEAAARIKKLTDSGQASMSEASNALAAAAEARAKMLQQQRDAAAGAGGAALEGMNRELMTLSIDCKELEAKLGYFNDRLPKLREVVDQIDELQRAERDADHARQMVIKTSDDLRKTQMDQLESGSAPPRVLLKDAQNEMNAEPR